MIEFLPLPGDPRFLPLCRELDPLGIRIRQLSSFPCSSLLAAAAAAEGSSSAKKRPGSSRDSWGSGFPIEKPIFTPFSFWHSKSRSSLFASAASKGASLASRLRFLFNRRLIFVDPPPVASAAKASPWSDFSCFRPDLEAPFLGELAAAAFSGRRRRSPSADRRSSLASGLPSFAAPMRRERFLLGLGFSERFGLRASSTMASRFS
mmetsp:Transcript_954/g.4017  ORF Transcript_954/g.4017 Transcript_954/m.4017 type:complete len:206 (-) Transcript_954:5001-5618(-)